jgi:hypothetical protein
LLPSPQRENLQLVQQDGAQLAAPQPQRQQQPPAARATNGRSHGGSGGGGGSSSSVSSMWRAPASSNRDDFTVVDEDTGVDDGFGDFSRASFEVDDFQSELDAAVRTQPA